ncbi:serine O-acetyltransferase [Vibrio antiquarius]
MIRNKQEYKYYLKQDLLQLGIDGTFKDYLKNDIWRFQRALRTAEYYQNCSKSKLLKLITRFRYLSISKKLGFTIPLNTFKEGLSIAHYGTIVVNGKARVGRNCRIHVCVNIGADILDGSIAPTIGDNAYIGPGAKLYGGIVLGDNVTVGANAVVNKSFSDGNCVLAGVPAKIISNLPIKRK